MSILIVEVLSEGLIFGADRNITSTYGDGLTEQAHQEPKVLKWPNDETLFGFVGAARINGLPIEIWLDSIKKDFISINSIEILAKELNDRVEKQRIIDEGNGPQEPLIMHLGRFEKKDGHWLPYVWHIRNIYRLGRFSYLDIRKQYYYDEQFWRFFPDTDPSEIRKVLKVMAKQFNPFWFHQGIDLVTFNVLQSSIKAAFKLLCEQHPEHTIPTTVEEWTRHVRMQVLMYSSYYEAFYPSGGQYVGGGADVLSLEWPN